jgi:hypothetical protein
VLVSVDNRNGENGQEEARGITVGGMNVFSFDSNQLCHYDSSLLNRAGSQPLLKENHEQKEDTKCKTVRIVLPSCAHIVAGERLRTNNHNHQQFTDTRTTCR